MIQSSGSSNQVKGRLKQAFFIVPDGREDKTLTFKYRVSNEKDGEDFVHPVQTIALTSEKELFRIEGEPRMRVDMVRISGGTADIRFRAEFPTWKATLEIEYYDQITPESLLNLLNRAGKLVGLGEGRPAKRTDLGWGKFEIDTSRKILDKRAG